MLRNLQDMSRGKISDFISLRSGLELYSNVIFEQIFICLAIQQTQEIYFLFDRSTSVW